MSYTRLISAVFLAAFFGLVAYGQIVRGQATRIPGPGGKTATAAPTQVQTIVTNGDNTGSSGTVTSASISTTAGNTLVVCSGTWNTGSSQTITISDSQSGTWTENTSSPVTPSSKTRNQQFHRVNITGGSMTVTITNSATAGTYITFFVTEINGVTTSPLDAKAGQANSASTSITSGVTGTRAQASEIGVGCMSTDDSSDETITAGTNWTIPTNGSQGSKNHVVSAVETQVFSSTGTDAAIFTLNVSSAAGALVETFKGN